MLGISSSLVKGGASLLTFVKDNLKLYLDFNSKKSDTLKFPSEGSTEFDGSDDYIDCGNDSSLQFSGSFSVGCWFKTTDATTTNEILVSKADDGVSAGWLIRLNSSRKLDFSYLHNASGGSGVVISDTGSAVNDGVWHHVVFVHESGVGNKAYKDGVLIGSNSTGTDLGSHTPNFHIGNQDYSTARAINADICNVFAYSRALEPEEIQSIMNKSYSQLKGVEKTSLVSWWGLDNSSDRGADFWDVGVFTQEGSPTTSTYSNGLLNVVGNGNNTGARFSFPSTGSTTIQGYNQYEFSFDIKITSGAGSVVKVQYHYSTGISSTFNDQIDTTEAPNQEFKRFVTTLYADNTYSSNRYFVFVQSGSTVCEFQVKNIVLKPITANDSEGSNHGQLVQEATTTTSVYGGNAPILPRAVDVAKEGQADAIGDGSALFNGSTDYIDLGDTDLFSFGNGTVDQPLSITLWANLDSDTQNMLLSKGVYNNNGEYVLWSNSSNKLSFELYNGSTYELAHTTSTITSYENEWIHIGVTYNGVGGSSENAGIKIYINGISQALTLGDNGSYTAMPNTTSNLHIGNYNNLQYKADGELSQLGIWKGELTQSQIQSVMESTSYSKIPADVKSTLGAERVLNSDFSDGENIWDLNNANVVNEVLEIDEGAFSYYAQQAVDGDGSIYRQFESGYLMKLEIVVDEYTSGSTIIYATGNNIGTFDSAGTHTIYYKPSANEYFRLRSGGSGFEGKISSVSIKRVTNDLVAYYPLDGSSSANGVTQDVTTGETLGSELISNGSFDTDTTGWIKNNGSMDVVNGELKVITSSSYWEGVRYNFGAVVSGGIYKAVFTARLESGNSPQIQFSGASGSSTYSNATSISGSSNVTYTFYFSANANNSNTYLTFFNGTASSSTFYLDNVSLKQVTSNIGVLK